MKVNEHTVGNGAAPSQGADGVKFDFSFNNGIDEVVRRAKMEQQQQRAAEVAAMAAPAAAAPAPVGELPWPPGMVGQLAQAVYNCAPRPVREIAITTALGIAAGICGREWTIPGSGLNLYIILLARSATGKEIITIGCSLAHRAVSEGHLVSQPFFDFSDCASGQALRQLLNKSRCFVQVSSEWGDILRGMTNKNDAAKQSLKRQLKVLYHKSAPLTTVGGLAYADPTKNIEDIDGAVAFSLLGECTPGAFMASLTESMMEDGTMSRLLVIEFEGDRPAANPAPLPDLPEPCKEQLKALSTHALTLRARNVTQGVSIVPDAFALDQAFDMECDREINSTKDESWRQMWNRAHLKVRRIAGLLAVWDGYLNPVVTEAHMRWSLDLVRRDIASFRKRREAGDIGESDDSRERKLMAIIVDYLTKGPPASYKIPPDMKTAGLVPRRYLQMRTSDVASFTQHKLGATAALDLAIRSLVDSGYMKEELKDKVASQFNFHGRCYRVLALADYSTRREK